MIKLGVLFFWVMNIIYCYLLQQYTLFFLKLKYRYKKRGATQKRWGLSCLPATPSVGARLSGTRDTSGVVWAHSRHREPCLLCRRACVGLCWPSLGAVGLRGPVLAFRGLLWACVGLRTRTPEVAWACRRWQLVGGWDVHEVGGGQHVVVG